MEQTGNGNAATFYTSVADTYSQGFFRIHVDNPSATTPVEVLRQSGTGEWLGLRAGSETDVLSISPNSGNPQFSSTGNIIFSPTNYVGIGTTSPDTLLSVGSATPVGNVAHFENSTGSCYINPTGGSVSCTSDARLKTNVNPLARPSGIAALLQLNPVTFNWTREPVGSPTHSGFIAQDVLKVFPDLVSQQVDGYYTMNYAGLTPYLVKAVQEIASISGVFEQNLIAWLGSASNGISDLFAKNLYAVNGKFTTLSANSTISDTITANHTLCIGSTCVTEAQLTAILAAAGQTSSEQPDSGDGSSSPSAAESSSTPTTPPVIAINGSNPAIIHVGDTYADLGATITGPQADLNLGIKTFLNGTLVSTITLDTSATVTDTIDYVATDGEGNTATSTRTVIVAAEASSAPATTATTSVGTFTSQ